jgi:hypothetical protein
MKSPSFDQIPCVCRPESFFRIIGRKIRKETNQPAKRILLAALALSASASVASAQLTVADIGATAPALGVNDIGIVYQVPPGQNDNGLNYYYDNGTPPGQTFTTGGNVSGYTLTNLCVETHGNGGGGQTASQGYTLRIYSVSGATATLIQTYTGTASFTELHWFQWSGLSVPMAANTQYAYTFQRVDRGYEQMADCGGNPYTGGDICLIPPAGGTINFGNGQGISDATFDAGLAVGTVAGGTVTLTDIGTNNPTPGPDDASQLLPGPTGVPPQNNYGLNYYWDNATPNGQTFTTLSNNIPFVMTSLTVGTVNGGSSRNSSQTFTLRIYSISGTGNTNASLIYSNSAVGQLTADGDWLQFNGLSLILATNRTYAFTVQGGSGYEEFVNYDGRHYTNGQICGIPKVGGKIVYGNGGTNYSDEGFDVGLTVPVVYANTPSYAPISPDGNVYAGTPITLNEAGVGQGTLFYQWQTDGGTGGSLTNIPGATNVNLTVDTTGFTANYNYDVIVSITNSGGAAMTSPAVTLAIVPASSPFIVTDTTASPDTTVNFVTQSQTFAASSLGTLPVAYQWQVSPNPDGSGAVNISGATNSTLVLNNLQLTNTGYYSLRATNSVSPFTINTTWTQLTVLPLTNQFIHWQPPVTFNGLTANQILTSTMPGTFLEGAYFGNAAGPINVTNNGIVYPFYGDGTKVSITGNSGATSGALFAGTNTTGNTNLDIVLNQFAFDGGTATHTLTLHHLQVGSNYCVQIFAFDDRGAGNGRATDFQDPANAADVSATYGMQDNDYLVGTFTANSTDVAIQQNLLNGAGNVGVVIVGAVGFAPSYAPTFLTQPSSTGAFPGRTVQFSATADGLLAPTYQWQISTDGGTTFSNLVNNGNISGATSNTLTIANVTLGNSGWQFMATATNSAGGVGSSVATLTVNAAPLLSGAYSTSVLALHPVAYWPLNEAIDPSAGGAGVYDASGNQYDGLYLPAVLNGFSGIVGPQAADGYPKFANGQGALRPQAGIANSWANTPALNLNTNTVTITMWINPVGAQADSTGLLVNRNAGTTAGITYSTGQALGYVWNDNESGTWSYTGGPIIPTDMWSLVALVITPTNASFYVINTNGATSTTYVHNHNSMSWGGASANIYLGADSQLTRVFNGVLDEPAVFNYALTPSQLQILAGLISVNTDPVTANFKATVTGGVGSQTMNFSWASDHQGWQLYTNSAGLTATNSWFPVPGSGSVTNESIAIDPTKTNTFFQLRYP